MRALCALWRSTASPYQLPQNLPVKAPRLKFPWLWESPLASLHNTWRARAGNTGQSAAHRAWLCENGSQAAFLDARSTRLSSRDSLLTVGCWGREGEAIHVALPSVHVTHKKWVQDSYSKPHHSMSLMQNRNSCFLVSRQGKATSSSS